MQGVLLRKGLSELKAHAEMLRVAMTDCAPGLRAQHVNFAMTPSSQDSTAAYIQSGKRIYDIGLRAFVA